MTIQETADVVIQAMEPKLFANLTEKMIFESSPSKILPLVKMIGKEWCLNLKKKAHNEIAKKILVNCAKNN